MGFAFTHPFLWARHSRCLHFNPLPVVLYFGASWFALLLWPGELLASRGPDRAHHAQPTKAFTSELAVESVALLAVGYNYSGIWVPPPAGFAPAGTFASFAARGDSEFTFGSSGAHKLSMNRNVRPIL
jgi:hypothetical protein